MSRQSNQHTQGHRKLDHISYARLEKISKLYDCVPEIIATTAKENIFDVCCQSKQVRILFNTKRTKATRPLKIIHTDVCGNINPPVYDRMNYVLTCTDDNTHLVKVYLMIHKNNYITSR